MGRTPYLLGLNIVLFKKRCLSIVFCAVLLLSACGPQPNAIDKQPAQSQTTQSVQVTKSAIAPTISATTTLRQDILFTVTAVARGDFRPRVKAGQPVSAGEVIGTNAGQEIVSPVNAIVSTISAAGEDLAKNLPLATLTYQGFGFEVPAQSLLRHAVLHEVQGKFQILDGQGPNECVAVVASVSENIANRNSSTSQPAGSNLLCLIDKTLDVRAGLQGTVVLTGTVRKDVLVLPVNAVAGRLQNGRVFKQDGQTVSEVAVQLGVSDGAYIEILSGVSEGDQILLTPPNLDPRVVQ